MLETFKWDDRYETGIDEVDNQHKQLVEMLNILVEVATGQRHAAPDEIITLLDGLDKYAKVHFSDEEQLMQHWGCDARHITAHTRQHAVFSEQVGMARTEYLAAGASTDILEVLASFVTSWLSFHILGSDKDMAGQIARIRAGQPAERRNMPEYEREAGATRILADAMGRLYELMAQRNLALANTRDDLAELNAHLEQRVAARTAELEQALAEVQRTREQLLQSEKMSAIGQLAAGVAHEINNPVGFVNSNLGSLHQYVGKLLDLVDHYDRRIEALPVSDAFRQDIQSFKQKMDFAFMREDISDLLNESTEGLERVKKIVQDMKTFSHVDQAEWQDANLNDMLDSTLNMVGHEIKYQAVVAREFGALPSVRCLPAQLSQVFMNILVNAAQAIERTPGKITVVTRAITDGVELIIEDNGKGIPDEALKHVFEPFFTTKPVGKGTGLGLSISYEIVKRHGGQIHVESTPGNGSRFTVQLPLDPCAEAVPA